MSLGLAADISALGRLTDRQSVLDYGLRGIVRRVQQVDGFGGVSHTAWICVDVASMLGSIR